MNDGIRNKVTRENKSQQSLLPLQQKQLLYNVLLCIVLPISTTHARAGFVWGHIRKMVMIPLFFLLSSHIMHNMQWDKIRNKN